MTLRLRQQLTLPSTDFKALNPHPAQPCHKNVTQV